MKLRVQGDDYGMTYGVADGICRAAAGGILTCTGLMVNFDSSAYAAEHIKAYPHVSVGIDINFFAGRCCADPAQVPHLVNKKGEFPLSSERKKAPGFPKVDPFPLDEALVEVNAQVTRFKQLMGHNPAYLQAHSYLTANLVTAMKRVSTENNILYVLDTWKQYNMKMYNAPWLFSKAGFSLEKQLATDVEQLVYDQLETLAQYDRALIVCHPGYLDNDLFSRSSYTVIRVKDLAMLTSPRIRRKLEELGVELVNYQTL